MIFSEYKWVIGQSQIRAYKTISLIKNISFIRKSEAQRDNNPMSKLGVIDLTKPTVQIDRINETAISVDQTSENYWIDEGLFNVINEEEFILLAKSIPGVYEPEQLWNVLFGHYSHDGKLGINPHVQYLTAAAGEQILHYWNKFQHGIDFQHLPKGFH